MTSAAAANAYRIRRFFYIGRSAQGGHGWRDDGLVVFVGRRRFFITLHRQRVKP